MANVYIFGSSDSGPVKVGYSRNPEGRLAALQGGHPFKLQIMRTWSHPQAYTVETEAKRSLRLSRTYGEWFAVGLQIAVDTIEQAIATVNARTYQAEPLDVEDGINEDPSEPGSLQHDQLERVARIEEIEAEMGCCMTRQQVFNLELSGVFGERWAEVRRTQGRTIQGQG